MENNTVSIYVSFKEEKEQMLKNVLQVLLVLGVCLGFTYFVL